MHLTDRQAGNQTDRSGLVQQVQHDAGRLTHIFFFCSFQIKQRKHVLNTLRPTRLEKSH